MKNEIVKFEFNGKAVDFEPSKTNVMVNATQMAKIFGKEIRQFNELESTKKFIEACIINRESRLIGIEKREDIILSKKNSGTWMHRILALKFAAWLDPNFDVWIFTTIEQLLFGDTAARHKHLTRKAEIQRERETLEEKLKEHPDYARYMELKGEEMRLAKEINHSDKAIVKQQYQLMFPETN